MITGKIPDWGFHRDEFRFASHRVNVEVPVESLMDWGMLGYYVGEVVGERIPVLLGRYGKPDLISSQAFRRGGRVVRRRRDVSPRRRDARAPSFEAAVGPNRKLETFTYGKAEQRRTYETLNARGQDTNVDYVMLGCPHAALEQIQEICRLLEGRKINSGVRLWVFTSRAIRAVADKEGYSKIIRDAGGVLITDTCSAIGQALPPNTKVAALDSAKQVHYLPAIMGIQAWFGTTAGLHQRRAHRPLERGGAVIVLHGRKVVGGIADGEALVTRQTISGWGGVNAMTGTIIETRHELRGVSFKDKVLVCPGAKGSSGWSSVFHQARLAGVGRRRWSSTK